MPDPLPKALELTEGSAVSDAVPDDDALVDVVVCGVTGVSIGTLTWALSLVKLEPDVDVDVDVVDPPGAAAANAPPVEPAVVLPVEPAAALPLVVLPVVSPPVVPLPVVPLLPVVVVAAVARPPELNALFDASGVAEAVALGAGAA